jgi:hypothetical protein
MFPWYFLIQGICGLLALATAGGWSRSEPRVRAHRVRTVVLVLAVVTVLVGWWLEHKVTELRAERNEAVDRVLQGSAPQAKDVEEAARLAEDFVRWHLYSLFLNFGTVALVTVAMALAARLPGGVPARELAPT